MPLRNVATNYTFEQQRQEINLLAADVDTLDTSVTALQGLQATETTDSPTFTNLTLSGYLAGPATLTIDPAAVGDNTGTVVIAGNLQVDGTTTTVNSTTMTVDDLSITLGSGAANAAAADGAGIDVDGATATFYYRSTPDAWASNKKLLVNQTSENASRANLEVTSSRDSSFPQYSYGIVATDDAAYNVNPGSGYGFGYKWNSAGNYAQGGGIRMIKENTNDNDYAGAMLFYTRPMGDGPLERLRIDSAGRLKVGTTNDIIWNQTSEDGVVIEESGATQIVRNGDVPLLVTRNTSTGQIVKFSQAGTERGAILYDSDFGIASAGDLTFDISGTEKLRLTTGGQLNLAGNMQFTAADPELEFNNGGPRFRVPAANTLTIHTGGGLGTTTSERLRITSSGHILPGADNTQDLGSSAKRFANIYSADLQLSNEGMGNDVDGTWGQYTIQEGENDLYLLNRRNGKTYKFVLQEVQ